MKNNRMVIGYRFIWLWGCVIVFLIGGFVTAVGLSKVANFIRILSYREPLTSSDCATFKGNGTTPGGVDISPDKSLFAAAFYDEVRVWDINKSELIATLPIGQKAPSCIEFSPDSQKILMGCTYTTPDDFRVQMWDISSQSKLSTFSHNNTWDIAFSPNGTILATVSQNAVNLWLEEDGTRLHNLRKPGYERSYLVEFSPNGKRIVVASWIEDHHEIFLWDSDGELLWQTPASLEQIADFNFSNDGSILYLITEGGEIQRYNVADGSLLGIDNLSLRDSVRAAKYSFDGEMVAISYTERNLDDLFLTTDQNLVVSFGPGESNSFDFANDGTLFGTQRSYDVQLCKIP